MVLVPRLRFVPTLALLAAAACSTGAAWEPVQPVTRAAADPDTQPLPEGPATHIRDPRASASAAASASGSASAAPAGSGAPASSAAPSASASATVAAAKPKPPAAGPAAAPPAAVDCGTKENPCPMQKLMRGMAAASTPEALEAAFTRVAGLSPSPGWQWSAIAKKGAELAKSGDVAAAKAQCKACHDAHREAYKSGFRGRKI
jgi:hypothetical protein